MKSADLFGIRLDHLDDDELNALLSEWLEGEKRRIIVTPNPEIILRAKTSSDFARMLGKADLSLPDGIGVLYAVKALHGLDIHRHTGTDTVERLAKLCQGKMMLIGGELPNVAQTSATLLAKENPSCAVAGYDPGVIQLNREGVKISKDVIERIQAFKPDIIAVGLGQEKQERFILQILPYLPSVKIAIGVGGAFDMISGAISRAPMWMRKTGFEWAWRLYLEPKRVKRIYKASVLFPFSVAVAAVKQGELFLACRRVFPLISKQILGKK